MESSIRDVSIFWKLSWGLENDNTLFKNDNVCLCWSWSSVILCLTAQVIQCISYERSKRRNLFLSIDVWWWFAFGSHFGSDESLCYLCIFFWIQPGVPNDNPNDDETITKKLQNPYRPDTGPFARWKPLFSWCTLWKYRSTESDRLQEKNNREKKAKKRKRRFGLQRLKKKLRSMWKWEEVFDSLLFTIRIPWNMQGIRIWWPKTWKTIIYSSKIDNIQLDNKYWPCPK